MNLGKKKGIYRFEVKNNPNGGAPILNIAKLDTIIFKSIQDTLYINRPVLKIQVNDNRKIAKIKKC